MMGTFATVEGFSKEERALSEICRQQVRTNPRRIDLSRNAKMSTNRVWRKHWGMIMAGLAS